MNFINEGTEQFVSGLFETQSTSNAEKETVLQEELEYSPVRYYLNQKHQVCAGLKEDADRTQITELYINDEVQIIEKEAFEGCVNLQTVHLPEALQEIDSFAFMRCASLETIVIPDAVTVIKDGTFGLCEKLKSVSLPDSLREIRDGAFADCKALQALVFPPTTEYIGRSAFCNTGLINVQLPEKLVSVDHSAFYACEQLETVSIPKTVRLIGAGAFENTPFYEKGIAEEWSALSDEKQNHLFIHDDVLLKANVTGETKLPETVRILANEAFQNIKESVTVHLPQDTYFINLNAFVSCKDITIEVPPNAKSLYGTVNNSHIKLNCKGNETIRESAKALHIQTDTFKKEPKFTFSSSTSPFRKPTPAKQPEQTPPQQAQRFMNIGENHYFKTDTAYYKKTGEQEMRPCSVKEIYVDMQTAKKNGAFVKGNKNEVTQIIKTYRKMNEKEQNQEH